MPTLEGKALDAIKVLAALLMVLDHINFMWYGLSFLELTMIGRGVFPLFCYAVASAVARADDERRQKYVTRLLLLAVMTEPLSVITRDFDKVNALFTLACGAALTIQATRMKDRHIMLCVLAALIFSPWSPVMEYGLCGIVLPVAFYMLMQGKKKYWPVLILLLLMLNQQGWIDNFYLQQSADDPLSPALIITQVLIVGFVTMLFSLPFIYMAAELSQKGRLVSKYFLHVFYPLHMVILWGLGLIFFTQTMSGWVPF